MIVVTEYRPSHLPGLLPERLGFSFYDPPQIIAECPIGYAAAMAEIKARDTLLGVGWLRRNAELAHEFWDRKKPWWL